MGKFEKGHKFHGDQSTLDRLLVYAQAMKGKPRSPEVIEKIRLGNLGRIQTEETRAKISAAHKGKKHSPEVVEKQKAARAGYKHSIDTIRKIKTAHLARLGREVAKTPENELIRKSPAYITWRDAVYQRDNWTCQKCHSRGVKLHAHHIRNFSEEPNQRFDINNGITLCSSHHLEFHNIYSRKNNNKDQIQRYLKSIECDY